MSDILTQTRIQFHRRLEAEREKNAELLSRQETLLSRIKDLEAQVKQYQGSGAPRYKPIPAIKSTTTTLGLSNQKPEDSKDFEVQYSRDQKSILETIAALEKASRRQDARLAKVESELQNIRSIKPIVQASDEEKSNFDSKELSKSPDTRNDRSEAPDAPRQKDKSSRRSKSKQRDYEKEDRLAKKAEQELVPSTLSREEVKKMFKRFDYNGNKILSLAEIDKALVEGYPEYSKSKPAIMRAYHAADTSHNGYIEFSEFEKMISFLHLFSHYYDVFQSMDTDDDHRITYTEFAKGYQKAFDDHDGVDVEQIFNEIDTNAGGYVLFDEFCIYLADKALKIKSTKHENN